MAFSLSDEVMMLVGLAVLTIFMVCDICMAYRRGAKWLPGNAIVLCGLSVQLLGYLDARNVSTRTREEEHDLEALIGKQLSIDSSRLVLFVFIGYLLPGLASSQGLWSNIAALCISLSTHIATELNVAIQFHDREMGKVVKGQYRHWLIASGFFLLESILLLTSLFVWALSSGRFIRDNLRSRIPSVLSEQDNEILTWETCKFHMLKSWLVARVCQPEYVLARTLFGAVIGMVVSFYVVFFGVKVVGLRFQLHEVFPLFTLQFVFVVIGWFVVLYRCFSSIVWSFSSRYFSSYRYIGLIYILISPIVHRMISLKKSPLLRLFLLLLFLFLFFFSLFLLLLCILLVGIAIVITLGFLVCYLLAISWLPMFLLFRKFFKSTPADVQEYNKYKEALNWVCMPGDDTASLWAANESSFNHVKNRIETAYGRGRACGILQQVIGSKLRDNRPPVVDQLLEPLESVERYFPFLKGSFRKMTACTLIIIMKRLASGERVKYCKKAYKAAEELMDLVDCPHNVGINVDAFSSPNLEAFEVRCSSEIMLRQWRSVHSDNWPTVDAALQAIKEMYGAAKELRNWKLLGDGQQADCLLEDLEPPNNEAVYTRWIFSARSYSMYKACKVILNYRQPCSVDDLVDDIFNMFANIVASCVRESPNILFQHSNEWAAEFREDKISAAIDMAGFAWGVIDEAQTLLI